MVAGINVLHFLLLAYVNNVRLAIMYVTCVNIVALASVLRLVVDAVGFNP